MTQEGRSVRGEKQKMRAQRRRLSRKAARDDSDGKSLIFIVGVSLGIGVIASSFFILAFLVSNMVGFEVPAALQQLVAGLGFIICFLISLLILINKYMPKGWMVEQQEQIKSVVKLYKPPEEKWGGALVETDPKFHKVFDDARTLPEEDPIILDNTNPTFDDPYVSEPPADDSESAEEDTRDENVPKPDFGGPPPKEEKETEDAKKADFGSGGGHGLESVEVSQETMEKVLGHLKYIIAEVTQLLGMSETPVNNYTKFGLNLFFAGACARLTKEFSLSAEEGMAVLARLMELTGVEKTMAYQFADNINEYGERPQYRKVVDAGDAIMAHHLNPENETNLELYDVIEEWNNPDNSVELPSVHTFMFTDIVDSTSLTEELGNFSMQKVIRAHNKAVREALERYGGTEVKHTGDGIMATFNISKFAVDAAVQIQQDINLFSRQKPKLGFDVRIGLHSGEAVMEDDDYFGTAVQTAARICDEAGPEEIWVNEEIERANWKDQEKFSVAGDFLLKGLSKEVALYTVAWDPIPDRSKKKKVDYDEVGGKKRKRA